MGSLGNIFSVGERELQENLFSALVPGAACECHIKLISALADPGLTGWTTRDTGGPPAVSGSLRHAAQAEGGPRDLRELCRQLPPFYAASVHTLQPSLQPEKSLINFQPRS